MKTLVIVAIFFAVLAIAWKTHLPNRKSKTAPSRDMINQSVFLTNAVSIARTYNPTSNMAITPDGCLKVILEEKSGRYAITDSTRKIVFLMDKNNHAILSTNLVFTLSKMANSKQGEITFMQPYRDYLLVYIGRDIFSINNKTGAVTYDGAN